MTKDEWSDVYKDGVDEGWENLRIGIVKRAVDDYVVWQNRLENLLNTPFPDEYEILKAEAKIYELERWFLSDWGQELSFHRGQAIIEKYRKAWWMYEHHWTHSKQELHCSQQDPC